VVGVARCQLGQRVVALYTGVAHPENVLRATLAAKLTPHAIPKSWIHVEHLPLDERGKLDRTALDKILSSLR